MSHGNRAESVSDESDESIEVPVPLERLPGHVGIIMDGNGRWARARGLPREEGHTKGADAVRTVVRAGRRIGLRAMTLFAFSSQNWDRPPEEVFHLMQLLRRYLFEERAEILDNHIRLTTVGDTDKLPEYVREPLLELMEASSSNEGMTLCLALSYGGRETIAKAVRRLCEEVAAGRLASERVDAEYFGSRLPTAKMPPLDLLVRTSGERRVSNFFLWEIAYAELYFSDVLWPDFGKDELVAAITDYGSRERRFGLLPEQVAESSDAE